MNSQRSIAFAALAGMLSIALAACGSDNGNSSPSSVASTGAMSPEPAVAESPDAFPISIAHKYGVTEIESEPTRVVTVGYTDHDVVLALGVTPIALRDWYGDFPNGVWPWAQDRLGSEQPTVLSGELDIEAIAALEPDLILGLYINLTEDEYRLLSQVAPTIAQSGDHPPYGTPWQEMTRTAGKAIGREAEAESAIAAVEERISKAREEHPEFVGLELVYAGVDQDGSIYVESAASTRVAVLTSLGFTVPAEINEHAGDEFFAYLSAEQLRMLDHDMVFWELGAGPEARPVIEANPLYQSLKVAKEGRHVFVDDLETAGALAHADVLSIPYFIDLIVPRLAAAVDGNPSTSSD